MSVVAITAAIDVPAPAVRPARLDRLPVSSNDDPFLRLAAGWLVGLVENTATAYRRDLEACVAVNQGTFAIDAMGLDEGWKHEVIAREGINVDERVLIHLPPAA